MSEVEEVLARKLAEHTGNITQREVFLTEGQRELVNEQAARIYDEYIESVHNEIGESGPEPDNEALEKAAFGYVLESVLRVGYELGQDTAEPVEEDDDLVHLRLNPKAAGNLLQHLLSAEE